MDRPLTQLEIQILRELPANASEVAVRLNKVQPQIYKSLNRLVELGVVHKDMEKVYHVEDGVQVPMPTELHEMPAWVAKLMPSFNMSDDELRIVEETPEAIVEFLNKYSEIVPKYVVLLDRLLKLED